MNVLWYHEAFLSAHCIVDVEDSFTNITTVLPETFKFYYATRFAGLNL